MVSYTTKTTTKKKDLQLPKDVQGQAEQLLNPSPYTPKETKPLEQLTQPKAPETPTPKKKVDTTPKIIRDKDTGKINGVELPDGRVFNNIKASDVSNIVNSWNKQVTPPAGSIFADEAKLQPTTMQQAEAAKSTELLTQNIGVVPDATQLMANAEAQKISGQIEANIEDRRQISKEPIVNIIGKITGALPSEGGIKKTILNIAGENADLRRYLDDYSNFETAKNIQQNIELSDGEITAAKALAAQPGYATEAKKLYAHALAKKRTAYSQLKRISQTDQRKYVDDIKRQMVALEDYFATQKQTDDIEILNSILKANV